MPPNDDPPPEETRSHPAPAPTPAWAPVTPPPPPGAPAPPPMPGAAQWPAAEGQPYGALFAPPRRPTDRLAIAALVTGLLGMVVLTIGFAIAVFVRTGRTGAQGRGLAVGGLAAALTWVVVVSIGAALLLAVRDPRDGTAAGDAPTVLVYPKVGECFDLPRGRLDTETELVPCDRPHEAEVVAAYNLPESAWPGQDEASIAGRKGCDQRLKERFHTIMPVEGGEIVALPPQKATWPRDREVRCAVAGPETTRLTGPVSALGYELRRWNELQAGACFDLPKKKDAPSVRLIDCMKRHDAQLTHRYSLPRGPFPGDRAVEKKAGAGCQRRMASLFRKHRPRVPVNGWFGHTSKAGWESGDRSVVCYVTAPKGSGSRLSEPVVPQPTRA
ncbi:DUF4190 domain-containing protein [Actinomadura terrae]|uniref:DUF4190 domain-containing protein n=1 Tax=Actinomadura terrae TaxID=604353 RepID=UPI001FA79E5C|nr:DUF4190 domain-containing protein [Actinomadura terrae]